MSDKEPKPAVSSAQGIQRAYTIPSVQFDPKWVTDAVKADLKSNIQKIEGFEPYFEEIYDAALRSISRGRDVATLFDFIMGLNLPDITKQRAREISLSLNNKASALINRDRQAALGIEHSIWVYSGAPCQLNPKKPSVEDVRQDAEHKAANGKRYEIAKGMFLNGRFTIPGWADGCRCSSRSIIPGFDE